MAVRGGRGVSDKDGRETDNQTKGESRNLQNVGGVGWGKMEARSNVAWAVIFQRMLQQRSPGDRPFRQGRNPAR